MLPQADAFGNLPKCLPRVALLWLTLIVSMLPADAQAPSRPSQLQRSEGVSDIWRNATQAQRFDFASPTLDSPTFLESAGRAWQGVRSGPVKTYGAYLIGAAVLAAAAFHLIAGPIRLKGALSGRKIPRFSLPQRTLHWVFASLFLLLGVTGLSLLFGRHVLQPLFGDDVFAAMASPLFAFSALALLVLYVRDNLPARADLTWLRKGALFARSGLPSWKFNAGEKLWFWIVIVTGFALSVSGLFLDFSFVAGSTAQIQIAHLVHVAGALIAITGAIGHIYLGSIGTEGALEGMVTGEVDVAWAEEHHSLWAAEARNATDLQPSPGAPALKPAE
jgi:formate dehydrogenase subunit gamma